MYRAIASFVIISLAAWSASAELRLPALFTDFMVLQRDAEAPVWGWADAGDPIVISIAGQTHETAAGDDGRWSVALNPLPAGGPHQLVVRSGNEAVSVRDVLVGEVWIASGQSNMQWSVQQSANPDVEIKAANHPNIRLFYVPRVTADSPQTDVEAEWTECRSDTAAGFSAVAYYFGRELHDALDVPIGLIHTSWGGTPAESWTSRPSLEAQAKFKPILERWDEIVRSYPEAQAQFEKDLEAYREAANRARENKEPEPPNRPRQPMGPDHPHRPSSLYNAMIAPLVPNAFQGAIWYQGESNAGRAYQYRTLFPAMIEDWRKAWGGRDFPFYFVQLANFRATTEDASEPSDWAELREAQTMTLGLDNTGMAVIIDIGEADDIHPKNKQDVGKRLALAALAETYGQEIPYSGPLYASMSVIGSAIRLNFDHVYDGLVAKGGELKGFAIAGPDQRFVWADARIDGETVVVSAEGVESPVAVRYAWANNPMCNLYNSAGLPASPFRTDDWPGVTVNNE